jgi:type II secretory pathway predicted ATPase ExeA
MLPTSQPASKRQHPGTPIGRVLNKYAISLKDLSRCLTDERVEFNSRSTLHRMVNGRISDEMRQKLHPAAARCLSKFLVARGLAKSEIDAELTAVFTTEEYQPMISKRNRLDADEYRFFGLSDDPFKNYPENREQVFFPPELRRIFDEVMDAIKYRHFVAVIGPIGSGKTTMREMIRDAVDRDGNVKLVQPFFMDQSKVTAIGIAQEILKACDEPHPPGRATALGTALVNKLRAMTENGRRVALDFDECHKMNRDTVRSLKNFFEMSSGGFQKYLGIVLFGWPSFVSTLETPEFQEIYERLHVINMPDFRELAPAYLAHRLSLVGCKDVSTLFDPEAVEIICSQSTTPLALGNIANEALRIMKRDFTEKKVLGAAIRTKMFFETNTVQAFRKRAVNSCQLPSGSASCCHIGY